MESVKKDQELTLVTEEEIQSGVRAEYKRMVYNPKSNSFSLSLGYNHHTGTINSVRRFVFPL